MSALPGLVQPLVFTSAPVLLISCAKPLSRPRLTRRAAGAAVMIPGTYEPVASRAAAVSHGPARPPMPKPISRRPLMRPSVFPGNTRA